jgi:acyl dehydratase
VLHELSIGRFGTVTEPRRRYFEDLIIGEEEWGIEEVAVKEDMVQYANRYDPWPIHVDEQAAQESPFRGLTASSGYSIGLWYSSANRGIWNHPERPVAMISGIDMRVRYPNPLRPGDRVRSNLVINTKRLSSKPGRGVVGGTTNLVNQDGNVVIAGEAVWLIETRP